MRRFTGLVLFLMLTVQVQPAGQCCGMLLCLCDCLSMVSAPTEEDHCHEAGEESPGGNTLGEAACCPHPDAAALSPRLLPGNPGEESVRLNIPLVLSHLPVAPLSSRLLPAPEPPPPRLV